MEKTHIIFVEGMNCQNCVKRIANELDNTRVDYSISLDNGTVTVKGNNDAIRAAKNAINIAGYTVK